MGWITESPFRQTITKSLWPVFSHFWTFFNLSHRGLLSSYLSKLHMNLNLYALRFVLHWPCTVLWHLDYVIFLCQNAKRGQVHQDLCYIYLCGMNVKLTKLTKLKSLFLLLTERSRHTLESVTGTRCHIQYQCTQCQKSQPEMETK